MLRAAYAAGGGGGGGAHALASGVVQITSLGLYNHAAGAAKGAILTNGVNITVLSAGFTGRNIAVQGATTVDSGAQGPSTPLDIAQQCTGGICSTDSRLNADDVFGVFSSAASDHSGTSFSYGDQKGSGTGYDSGNLLLSCGAASVAASGSASASATTAYALQFQYIADTSSIIDVDFTAAEYLEAYLNSTSGSATAQMATTLSLHDDTASSTVWTWAPDGAATGGGAPGGTEVLDPFSLNATKTYSGPQTAASDFVGSALGTKNSAGHFHGETGVLTAGHTYTLTITITITITLTSIA